MRLKCTRPSCELYRPVSTSFTFFAALKYGFSTMFFSRSALTFWHERHRCDGAKGGGRRLLLLGELQCTHGVAAVLALLTGDLGRLRGTSPFTRDPLGSAATRLLLGHLVTREIETDNHIKGHVEGFYLLKVVLEF